MKTQEKFIQTIIGLEYARINDYGYAVEYDCVDASELNLNYETKKIKGLFLAGQINGTTGYEEAAAQGLLAGINATRSVENKESFVVERSQGYLGVLTSDLNKGGLVEPYRMFTSRAEYRLLLRADNADERLTDLAISVGTAEPLRKKVWNQKKEVIFNITKKLKKLNASPQKYLSFGLKINQDGRKRSAYDVLGYKDSKWSMIESIWPDIKSINLPVRIKKQIKTNSFYERYIGRHLDEIKELQEEAQLKLRDDIDYKACSGLSNEVKEILSRNKPKSIGEARELVGMTPAAAAILLRFVKK